VNKEEVNAMAAKAFILITTTGGRTKEVVDGVRLLEGVKSVDSVTGPYDVIAVVEAEDLDDIGDLVTGKIYPLAGISRRVTCQAIKTDKT